MALAKTSGMHSGKFRGRKREKGGRMFTPSPLSTAVVSFRPVPGFPLSGLSHVPEFSHVALKARHLSLKITTMGVISSRNSQLIEDGHDMQAPPVGRTHSAEPWKVSAIPWLLPITDVPPPP
jgi:hypothetical protein